MTRQKQISKFQKPLRAFLCTVAMFGIVACSTPEEVKQSHYENGLELLEEQDYVKAGLEFRNALQIDETFVPAWYGLSLVEEENEAWETVIILLRRIVELEPTHVDAQVRLGTMMMMIGELDTAVEISETVLLLDNQHPDILALRAAVLLKLDDTAGAIDFANRALAIEPGNLKAIQILAAERYTKRDYEGALDYINQSGLDISQNKDLTLISIMIHETKGDLEQAEEHFRQLLQVFPDDEEIRNAFVSFYLKHENVDAAEAQIRNLAAMDPTDYERSIDVVRFINSYRGAEAAEAELNLLIQRGTEVVRYQLALAEFHLSNDRDDAASEVLNRIVDRTGSSEDGLIARARLGELALEAENYDEASRIIEEILEIDNLNINALEMRGSIYLKNNQYDNAIQDLRIVLSEAPNSPRASMFLATAYQFIGSIELADDTLADALRLSENNATIAVAYAEFLVKQSAPERAEAVLIESLNFQPRNLDLLRSLARVRLINQDWLGADEVASAIKQIEEGDITATQIQGLALSGQQNYEQSIIAFRDAYTRTPGTVRPLTSLIGAYIRAGKQQEAMEFLDGVLAEDEDNYQALIHKGQLYLIAQNAEQAVATFEKAISAFPQIETAYINLVGYNVNAGQNQQALDIINEAVDIVDTKVGLMLLKANIHERSRDFEAAIAVYEEMYAENATFDVVANNLASLLSEYRTDEPSMERAQQLAQRFRQSSIPHFKDTLGWIYYKTGDIQAATSILQDVVEQLPTNAIFRYHLGMVYMAGGRNAAAVREFEEVVSISQDQPFEQLEEVKELLAELNTPS